MYLLLRNRINADSDNVIPAYVLKKVPYVGMNLIENICQQKEYNTIDEDMVNY